MLVLFWPMELCSRRNWRLTWAQMVRCCVYNIPKDILHYKYGNFPYLHVWLLGWFGYSSLSTKELRVWPLIEKFRVRIFGAVKSIFFISTYNSNVCAEDKISVTHLKGNLAAIVWLAHFKTEYKAVEIIGSTTFVDDNNLWSFCLCNGVERMSQ